MDEPLRPFSVSELTAQVKLLVEETFPDVWVAGEVGNLVFARSGHVYLTLKDEGACLSAVIWRSQAERLRFDLSEGLEVLVRGRLNVYPPRGQYQLDVRRIEPRGVGALQQAFEKLRARLAEEGLFDPARKRPIPFLPRTIGVVTSPTGAAIRDILKVLERRHSGVGVLLWPARVQGEGAAEEIAAGIRGLAARGGVDVLIVGRGGGSAEDLWSFNEEPVARAIAACPVPVISAVGHEVDVTIADLVADLRAPTPSAAAELAAPSEAEVRATLESLSVRLGRATVRALERRRERLAAVLRSFGFRRLPDRLRQAEQRLDELARRAARGAREAVRRERERLSALAGRAESLSPLRVLARGYSVTTLEGESAPLRRAAGVRPGARVAVRLAEGRLLSRVEEVNE